MRHFFIINPAAGSCDQTAAFLQRIESLCGSRGLEVSTYVSTGPGDCQRAARQAAQAGEEVRIYACGGDGTLNEVAAGAAGFSNAAVTAYPGGSGNDFVKIFSEPRAFRDLERLLDAEEMELDLIDCNGWLSLNILSVGLDARIGTDVSNYKRLPLLHGFRAYALSALINVCKGISEHYRIEIDGEVQDQDFTLACVCNGRYYGGGFNPYPQADPRDGVLNVLLVDKVHLYQVPGLIGKYKAGRYQELGKYIHPYAVKALTIHCDKETVLNLDGEARYAKDFHIRLADQKLRFFYPKGLSI